VFSDKKTGIRSDETTGFIKPVVALFTSWFEHRYGLIASVEIERDDNWKVPPALSSRSPLPRTCDPERLAGRFCRLASIFVAKGDNG
jgi:hypothetical protein